MLIVAVVLLLLFIVALVTVPPAPALLKTEEGKKMAHECIMQSLDSMVHLDDSTAFIPTSALERLRACMVDRGFTQAEAELAVESLKNVGR